MGSLVGVVLGRVGRGRDLSGYRIFPLWNEIVGPLLAARTAPEELRDGILTVRVAGSSWMQEMRFLEEELLQRIRDRLGASPIRGLRFVDGPVKPPGAGERGSAAREPRRPEHASDPVPDIADPRLAELFARIVEHHNERYRQGGRGAGTERRPRQGRAALTRGASRGSRQR